MAAFHVFVDGATDSSPPGLQKLADAIAKQYGLPAADLLARLQKGRFRVKANTDRATAETYVRDLERLGARCTIEEATQGNSRATPLPFAAVTPPTDAAAPPTTTPPPTSALPPRTTAPPPPTSALPPRTTAPPPPSSALPPRASTPPPVNSATSGQFQSGLAAAFAPEAGAASADLGALGMGDTPLSLASVDGAEDSGGGTPGGSFGPAPNQGLPATFGPPAEKAPGAAKAKPVDAPLDMFAPPESQGEELKVELASDGQEMLAKKRAATPPPVEAEAAAPPARKSQPSMQPPNARKSQPSIEGGVVAAASPSKFGPLAEPRVRFAAGVILAVLLGFIPAHVVASMREESAFAEIDRKVIKAQQAAVTPELYDTLERMRVDQLARKQGEQRNAAIIGFIVWALAGAAIAFGWFKKIPWDD